MAPMCLWMPAVGVGEDEGDRQTFGQLGEIDRVVEDHYLVSQLDDVELRGVKVTGALTRTTTILYHFDGCGQNTLSIYL